MSNAKIRHRRRRRRIGYTRWLGSLLVKYLRHAARRGERLAPCGVAHIDEHVALNNTLEYPPLKTTDMGRYESVMFFRNTPTT